MQTVNEEVKEYLDEYFENVRKTEKGFKINIKQLNKSDLMLIDCIPANVDVVIKRSGAGLVVILE